MYTFIIVLIIITCFLLGIVVLVQNSKGGGLAAGLSSSNQVMGVRKTTDLLEKLTWSLAIALVTLSLIANFLIPRDTVRGSSILKDQLDNTPAAPAPNAVPPANAPAPAPAPQNP
jgi:preprotein translocase subunit SecG